jgi:hypothetical protein
VQCQLPQTTRRTAWDYILASSTTNDMSELGQGMI